MLQDGKDDYDYETMSDSTQLDHAWFDGRLVGCRVLGNTRQLEFCCQVLVSMALSEHHRTNLATEKPVFEGKSVVNALPPLRCSLFFGRCFGSLQFAQHIMHKMRKRHSQVYTQHNMLPSLWLGDFGFWTSAVEIC